MGREVFQAQLSQAIGFKAEMDKLEATSHQYQRKIRSLKAHIDKSGVVKFYWEEETEHRIFTYLHAGKQ